VPKLKSPFTKDGICTAANSSKLDDGACAISKISFYCLNHNNTLWIKKILNFQVLMSEEKLKKLNAKPLARIVSYADAEAEPIDFCIAPIASNNLALKRAGLTFKDMDFIEINEAFAVTVLVNIIASKLDPAKVNAHGGAIALGHPIG